jgi:hypothetical protein
MAGRSRPQRPDRDGCGLPTDTWSSQTVQDNRLVAEMAGTYDQTKRTEAYGTLVFKPMKAKTDPQHGKASIETDAYVLENGGKILRLGSGKNAMVFHKQPYAEE